MNNFTTGSYIQMRDHYLTNCVFCTPLPDIVLYSTENFHVLLDIAPILEGHLQICSKAHISCAGEIAPHLFPELNLLKEKIRTCLSSLYGNVQFFEHGRAGHCIPSAKKERCCHHFHLHALPSQENILSPLQKRFQEIAVDKYEKIYDLYERYGEYLYYEQPESKGYFYPVVDKIEPHLLRSVFSEAHMVSHRSNWSCYTDSHLFITGLEKISLFFKKCPKISPSASI